MYQCMKSSADRTGGWKNHFARLTRWKQRIEKAFENPTDYDFHDVNDFVLTYFVWCHSGREWLINSGVVRAKFLDMQLSRFVEWEVCRDIANRQRHFEINRKPRDKDWSIGREYNPFNPEQHKLNIYSGDRIFDALDLMERSHRMWEEISYSFDEFSGS